jgi:UDP-N-acetyl-D-glucosamine/UDP-N-acetyl-D-galactosamine dehydrogenase
MGEMSLERNISVIGLGYVGLPVAIAFGKKVKTIGFDINAQRISELKAGNDKTLEISNEDLKSSKVEFTSNPEDLKKANFHIVAVPTPVDHARKPDLTPLLKASETLGKVLKKGDIVVYESTVYPGCTEEDCVPVLEKFSGLKFLKDFTVGYSPERINPGDKEHTFTKIKKVVSGSDAKTAEIVAEVYSSVVLAGVFRAATIKCAEAAKVIENTQRDLNIALMNELSLIFDRMGIDTLDVLEAAGTKWNFLKFKPGLVGGHCIGVDPYYLTYKAESLGYAPQVILAGRRINDDMGKWIAHRTVKELTKAGHHLAKCTITVLGLTFKENVPDLRNSKVIDIIRELQDYGLNVQIHDPHVSGDEAFHEYGVRLTAEKELKHCDALIVAVPHNEFKEAGLEKLSGMMNPGGIFVDVKGLFDQKAVDKFGHRYWRL